MKSGYLTVVLVFDYASRSLISSITASKWKMRLCFFLEMKVTTGLTTFDRPVWWPCKADIEINFTS